MNYVKIKQLPLLLGIFTGLGLLGWVGSALFQSAPPATPSMTPASPAPVSLKPSRQQSTNGEAGLFFVSETQGRYYEAPALKTDVESHVHGMLIRTTVRQHFYNPSNQWLEGLYVFPLPEHSAVDHMQMWIGGRFIEGRIHEKTAARQKYRKAKQEGKRAGLVSSARDNVFTTRVANVGPGEEVMIEIHYQDTVRYQDHRYVLRFPLVVAPRYVPGKPVIDEPGERGTQDLPDAGEIHSPIQDPEQGAINPVSVTVHLDPGFAAKDISSLYHPVNLLKESSGEYLVTFANGLMPADRDFVLEWQPVEGADPLVSLFAEQVADDTYLHGVLFPPDGDIREHTSLPRDVVLVVDVSGSMAGSSITQVQEALSVALDQLQPDDRLNVITFADQTFQLFEEVQPATPANLAAAHAFINDLTAEGGTEILPALRNALSGQMEPARLRQIIVLTDGAIGYEEQAFELIHRHLGRQRLFMIGIGSAPNGHFMREAAEQGRGIFLYIGDVKETKDRMVALFQKLNHPVVTDLTLAWERVGNSHVKGKVMERFPSPIPDLYAGEPVPFSIKLTHTAISQLDGSLSISGQRGSEPWRHGINLSTIHEASGVAKIWAREKIAQIMTDIRRGTVDREQSTHHILSIALAHQLVTPFTSLVAVDHQVARPPSESLQTHRFATNLPAGWKMPAMRKEQALPNQVMPKVMVPRLVALSLPQTATLAQVHLLLGWLLLIAFSGLYFLYRQRKTG